MQRHRRLAALSVTLATLLALPARAEDHYVDDRSGDDAHDGSTPLLAWRGLSPVAEHAFEPGDRILLCRDGDWDAADLGMLGLYFTRSGAAERPITLTAYGDGSAAPTIHNSWSGTEPWVRAVTLAASWVVVDGLRLVDANEFGLVVQDGGEHNVIRACEFTGCSGGVSLTTSNNLVTRSWFHDFHILTNTEGAEGTPEADDDSGAIAVLVTASDNEISYNRMERCVAPSYDYGVDGGGVEFYVGTASLSGIHVHHNWIADGNGFFEIGSQGGSMSELWIHHNVSVNNLSLMCLHNGGGNFGTAVTGVRFENNTVVETEQSSSWLVAFDAAPTKDTLTFRNNLVVVGNYDRVFSHDGFTHERNLFTLTSPGTTLGVTLGAGESEAAARFVDDTARNFELAPDSPAIDVGAELGYALDFSERPIPVGAGPDLGAYERQPDGSTGGQGGGGGASATESGGTSDASATESGGNDDSGGQSGSGDKSGGCGCEMAGAGHARLDALIVLAALSTLGRMRRARTRS
jgi:hypothetical protein